MKLMVAGREYDLTELKNDEIQSIYKEWHSDNQKRTSIKCMCNLSSKRTPNMAVRNVKGKCHLYNLPTNNIEHANDCEFNRSYQKKLRKHGIKMEDGKIKVDKLDTRKKHVKGKRLDTTTYSKCNYYYEELLLTSRLSFLFLTMLQMYNWQRFNPNWKRDLYARLTKSGYYTEVEGKVLNPKMLFIAKEPFSFNKSINSRDSFRMIIGWGNIEKGVTEGSKDFLRRISLYSVNEPDKFVTTVEVTENVYKEAKEVYRKLYNSVTNGFWVVWRSPKGVYLNSKYLCFIPAETDTKIPVDSSYEEKMVKELVLNKRYFSKPLIGDLEDEYGISYRPDMILLDTKPHTMVEVAGLKTEKYLNHLEGKERTYRESGYQYLKWNAAENEPLPSLKKE